MAYDENLANRVRERLVDLPNIEEKAMMGGLTFMYNNKMCVGIIKDELMCRINPELHDKVVEENGCRTMDFTKRLMRGYIMIDEEGMKTKKSFDYWIDLALVFNPLAKSSKKPKKQSVK
ncbi:MAG: TfoX/Sxy family protein [Bacteroidales bacterium]|jgi:TfoX/Sxy family transcriptional regulator of competence genes|nr:TfoX/Sxy family protein [Bacteroidales bacterium]